MVSESIRISLDGETAGIGWDMLFFVNMGIDTYCLGPVVRMVGPVIFKSKGKFPLLSTPGLAEVRGQSLAVFAPWH